jgi:hypothetical protein
MMRLRRQMSDFQRSEHQSFRGQNHRRRRTENGCDRGPEVGTTEAERPLCLPAEDGRSDRATEATDARR